MTEKDLTTQASDLFNRLAGSYINVRSLTALVIFTLVAYVAGRIIAALLRRLVSFIGRQADKTSDLQTVNLLRRYETILVLSIVIVRTLLMVVAIYAWWIFVQPSQQPTALIGASALIAIIIGGALGPALRDISFGSVMMAEQWYGVGDHVRVEPFADMQGVVERVTLRSTRIRGLNGEIIWVNNQNIQAIRLTPKGIRTIAIELFVNDLAKGHELVASTNRRLPDGELLVINPLEVMSSVKAGENLWHITAIAETAPGREWLIEKYAIEVMTEIDEKRKLNLLATEPVARFADSEAERRFARSISNARKTPAERAALRTLVKQQSARAMRATSAKKPSSADKSLDD